MAFSRVEHKDQESIAREWDQLAPVRYEQIISGKDLTYNEILAPEILSFLSPSSPPNILDVGCGVGVLTSKLSKFGSSIIGIDPSTASLEIAKRNFGHVASFYQESMESYVCWNDRPFKQFGTIVANMVIMDALSLSNFLDAVVLALHQRGQFIFSFTHPCFWPKYYGYASEAWFAYNEEIVIESPFRISADGDGFLVSTHVHRPLHQYFDEFKRAGLQVDILREPLPSKEVMKRYPAPWKYPRYLVGRCSIMGPPRSNTP